jgi:hypothetical protein
MERARAEVTSLEAGKTTLTLWGDKEDTHPDVIVSILLEVVEVHASKVR